MLQESHAFLPSDRQRTAGLRELRTPIQGQGELSQRLGLAGLLEDSHRAGCAHCPKPGNNLCGTLGPGLPILEKGNQVALGLTVDLFLRGPALPLEGLTSNHILKGAGVAYHIQLWGSI